MEPLKQGFHLSIYPHAQNSTMTSNKFPIALAAIIAMRCIFAWPMKTAMSNGPSRREAISATVRLK